MTKIIPGSTTPQYLGSAQYLDQKQSNRADPTETSNHEVPPKSQDRAEISVEAHDMLELRKAVDAGRSVLAHEPDVRAEKVALAKERLASGFYQSAEVRDRVSTRLSYLFMEHPLF